MRVRLQLESKETYVGEQLGAVGQPGSVLERADGLGRVVRVARERVQGRVELVVARAEDDVRDDVLRPEARSGVSCGPEDGEGNLAGG